MHNCPMPISYYINLLTFRWQKCGLVDVHDQYETNTNERYVYLQKRCMNNMILNKHFNKLNVDFPLEAIKKLL